MDLPYNWDFIQNNIPPEKLAELRMRFMEEWRSGRYTKKQMMERFCRRYACRWKEFITTETQRSKEEDMGRSTCVRKIKAIEEVWKVSGRGGGKVNPKEFLLDKGFKTLG